MFEASATTNFKGQALTRKVDNAKRRWMFSFGSYAMKTAQRSMKPAPKKPKSTHGEFREVKRGKNKGKKRFVRGQFSRPGNPPQYRNKGRGIRTMRFHVNVRTLTVKFGPIKLSNTSKRTSRIATNTMEAGGTITIKPARRKTTKQKRKPFRPFRATFEKRPYIIPAAMKGLEKLRSQAKGSIR
jgi:hypothetical protein